MEAGRELDALVAEEVFDAKWFQFPLDSDGAAIGGGSPFLALPEWRKDGPITERPSDVEMYLTDGCPNYSVDISDAWKVVERLYPLETRIYAHPAGTIVYIFDISEHVELVAAASAATAPLAICLAALKAVEIPEVSQRVS